MSKSKLLFAAFECRSLLRCVYDCCTSRSASNFLQMNTHDSVCNLSRGSDDCTMNGPIQRIWRKRHTCIALSGRREPLPEAICFSTLLTIMRDVLAVMGLDLLYYYVQLQTKHQFGKRPRARTPRPFEAPCPFEAKTKPRNDSFNDDLQKCYTTRSWNIKQFSSISEAPVHCTVVSAFENVPRPFKIQRVARSY